MSKQVKIVPDDLILCINDFKRSLNGQTINVMGKDYATVALRLAVARRNLGARLNIATEVMHNDKETCVVKATVSINDKIVATGLAEEKKNASRINQTSALENCETSAVGRALAFCGMTNDKIASAEEVSAAIEQQSKKVQEVLKSLQSVSHLGNYQKWITDNKTFLADLLFFLSSFIKSFLFSNTSSVISKLFSISMPNC